MGPAVSGPVNVSLSNGLNRIVPSITEQLNAILISKHQDCLGGMLRVFSVERDA